MKISREGDLEGILCIEMGDLFVDCYFSYSLQDLVVQTFFYTFFLSFFLSFVKCFVVSFASLPFFVSFVLRHITTKERIQS